MYRQKLSVSTQLYMKLVVAFVDWKGQMVTVAKGYAWLLRSLTRKPVALTCMNASGRLRVLTKNRDALSSAGYKTIAIAMCFGDARKEDHGPWKFVDIMPMLDPPREDTTAATIVSLHHAKVSV
ncbi:hypothetical protein FRACYDRAFT_243726 [Fragilariopsis cylindrus CCMP1102]|uniref:Uncharacterized protein n=1 Tax=Fragilariopsis cylindrus CCMP1102 TaxID=635003 RepID=A0A1E7F3Q0_9STRA|nr:hypothetical protein FRACYDRAFT_243726 [Fragilariopsis cylindrus CCMP1102]|eukprot:OEU12473.1 hypothetical protein FRACYDRAFT_243726 [Fragilariopsis cylindrus CCMP1102]